eukprot:COSAG01_NODE_1378_length_10526_cov_13.789105_3_plen_530_part_00
MTTAHRDRSSLPLSSLLSLLLSCLLPSTATAGNLHPTALLSNITCCVFWPIPGNQTRAGCEAGGDAKHDGGTYHWNTGRGTPSATCGPKLQCNCCRTGPPNKVCCKDGRCPSKPPAPAPPPWHDDAPGVDAFTGGQEGYGWYFFPRLQRTPNGELLVFSEAHKLCGHASDKGYIDIVLKRSSDLGATWGPVELVHSEYSAVPGTWIGNPAPLIDFEKNVLWLLMTRNNTDVLAMHSLDWGHTWTTPLVISEQVLNPEWRSKPSWQGGWGWVATTGGLQLKAAAHAGRLLVVGDVQTPPTANCSSPYLSMHHPQHRWRLESSSTAQPPPGLAAGDGKSCSQSWACFSDNHGATWNYSRTLLLPGDEVANPAELSNGSVVVNMRGHDLRAYDQGNPNNAMRWLGRSDNGGSTWPSDVSHMRPLMNGSSAKPMHFGGDCFGDMTGLPKSPDVLVMGAIHSDGSGGGIHGRSDYRVHKSLDGGASWKLVKQVYPGLVSYSGIQQLNSTHVGVMYNAGPMTCNAKTKFVIVYVG